MSALDYMDRPIAFHRIFVTLSGSVNAALMLSQAIYWSKRTKDSDGWFYKSAVDWEKETGLTKSEQQTARRLLTGVLEEKLAGMPATTHFRVTSQHLREYLANKRSSSWQDSRQQVERNPANKLKEKPPTTNSTETTTETTTLSPHAAMIRLWASNYLEHFGCEYAFQSGKDAKSVQHLLASTKLPPEELIAIAKAAWANGAGFYCKSAASITGFNSKFNEIRLELKNGASKKANPKGDRNAGTANEGKSAQYKGVGKVRVVQDAERPATGENET